MLFHGLTRPARDYRVHITTTTPFHLTIYSSKILISEAREMKRKVICVRRALKIWYRE